MSNTIEYHSALAAHMTDFVALKRSSGYDYTDQAVNLTYFDRFLLKEDNLPDHPILTLEQFQRYVGKTGHLKLRTRSTRLSVVREFSRYLHALHGTSAILPAGLLPRIRRKVRFFPISPEQAGELITAVPLVVPDDPILAPALGTLIGLLYSTGLRIAEALALTLGSVDRERSVLRVDKGKFGKERLVPVTPSTLAALGAYLQQRDRYAGNAAASPLLIGRYDRALTYGRAHRCFQRVCRHCKLWGDPRPRLHDLRHNYACQCLAMWRKQRLCVNAMLPVLATAMGHVSMFSTQLYLHVDAAALQEASDRTQAYISSHTEVAP